MENIVLYEVFINKYSRDHQTIHEAISNYMKINALKVALISKLSKRKYSKKIGKIENLCKEEMQYFEWIKVKLSQYPGSNKDVAMNSDSSDSSIYSDDANIHSLKGGNNQNAMHFDVININNHNIYNDNHSVEGSDDAKHDKLSSKRRQDPPSAPSVPSAIPPPSAYNVNYSYSDSDDDDDDGVLPKNLKINVPKENKVDGYYDNHGKKRKDEIAAPCTPSSQGSDGEQEEKYDFKLPANDNLKFIQSMDTTPPPNAYIPEPGAVGITAQDLMIAICEVLMQSYPLPVCQQVIEKELATKYDYHTQINEISQVLKDYDCVFLHNNGYYYILPERFEQTLLTNQVYEREKIIKNKLKFLMDNVHKDGMTMDDKNIFAFFKHFIGWNPSKQDVELMYILLSRETKRFPDGYGARPLREILSFKEMLICSLHSIDYNGCSRNELSSALRSRFGIGLDLTNPFIKEILDEISDPNVFKARGNYKLGFKTKQVNRALLQWWSAHYEPVNCNINPPYNEYNKYYINYNDGNTYNNGNDSFGSKQFNQHNNMVQNNNWHCGIRNSYNGEEYG